MEHATNREHMFFTNTLKKKLAKRERMLRKTILQQKKFKRLKTGNEENNICTSNCISIASSSKRTPLASIDTNIPTNLTMNTQFQGTNIASTSTFRHNKQLYRSRPQSNTMFNIISKK